MAFKVVPRENIRFPMVSFPSFMEDFEEFLPTVNIIKGLSISEDDKNIYVEAAVPGLDPKDIDITFDRGILSIHGDKKEEEKKKKYYRKATSSFSYRTTIPGEVDPNAEPDARCKNGVMTVTFVKSPKAQPKKIAVKTVEK